MDICLVAAHRHASAACHYTTIYNYRHRHVKHVFSVMSCQINHLLMPTKWETTLFRTTALHVCLCAHTVYAQMTACYYGNEASEDNFHNMNKRIDRKVNAEAFFYV